MKLYYKVLSDVHKNTVKYLVCLHQLQQIHDIILIESNIQITAGEVSRSLVKNAQGWQDRTYIFFAVNIPECFKSVRHCRNFNNSIISVV